MTGVILITNAINKTCLLQSNSYFVLYFPLKISLFALGIIAIRRCAPRRLSIMLYPTRASGVIAVNYCSGLNLQCREVP